MGQCTIGGVRIITSTNSQTNDKYTNFVIGATTSRNVADLIVSDINSSKFQRIMSKNAEYAELAKDSIFNLDGNKFKKYVRMYEKQEYPSVAASAYKGQVDSKGEFDSADTKKDALEYTGNLAINVYYKLAAKRGISKINDNAVKTSIRKEVARQIRDNLLKRALSYAETKNNKKAYENLENIAEQLIIADKRIVSARKHFIEVKKTNDNDAKVLWATRLKAAVNDKEALTQDLLTQSHNLFKGDIDALVNQNYLALANQVLGNKIDQETWFSEVGNLPSVFNIRELFTDIREHDKVNDFKDYDEYNIESLMTEDEIYSIDASTANWDDSIYSDYLKHYDGRLKLYFSSLFRLKDTSKTEDGQYNYETDNKLGVAQTMGAGYIIAQLSTFGDFSSVNNFIASVREIANNIPGLAGLIKLADDMENDRSFANMVASNLAKPVMLKNMIIYNGTDLNVVHSNQAAYASTQIFNRLMSISKITLNTFYDESVDDISEQYLIELNKINNPEEFKSSRIKIGNFIVNYFKTNFAGINPDIIENYYYTTDNNEKLNRAKRLLEIINRYNKQIPKVQQSIAKESERVRRTNEQLKKTIANTLQLPEWYNVPLSSEQRAQFNPDAVDYTPIISVIGQLSELLSGQMPSNVELNSGNAENNMSSDVIKNSYLTNFLKQLNYIIENPDGTENQQGVELLKDFLTKKGKDKATGFYEYSTILFGVKNPRYKKGSQQPKYLREGLFIKDDNGVITLNPNAKNLINIILFNGIKNTNVRDGQLYQNMSRSDYFTSIVACYFSPINYNRQIGNGSQQAVTDYAQVLLRIPSDASNQYAIQMPKWNTDNLYNYDEKATKDFINEELIKPYTSLKGINDKFTKRVANNLYDDIKLSAIFKNKKKNFIDTETAANILYDGGINGLVNLYGYYHENNGKLLPLVVKSGNSSFIIYLESNDATWKSGKNYKIKGISSLDGTRIIKEDPLLLEKYTEIQYKPVNEAIYEYFISHMNTINEFAFNKQKTTRQYNKNSVIYQGFKNQLFGEFNGMFNAISDIFENIEGPDGRIHYVTKENTTGLFDYYHYDKDIVKDGKLTGSAFTFTKLFTINNYNAGELIEQALNLYGENGLFKPYGDGKLELNLDRIDLINQDLTANFDNIVKLFDSTLGTILDKWLDTFSQYINDESSKYSFVTQNYTRNQIQEALINQTLAYMEFDDLFEGNSKFYKDAQTFLKRDKEVQAGGQAYMGGVDLSDDIGAPIHDINDTTGNPISIQIRDRNGKFIDVKSKNFSGEAIVDGVLTARNGFRAITIKNTIKKFDISNDIYNKIKEQLLTQGISEEFASSIAENIASGYGYGKNGQSTKVNDAQSYITFEEFIRRKWADGTISEYGDLIEKILDENYKLTEADYDAINRKIQVQKNFYYDIAFDDNTGLFYPRQIKNAEFVLIPRFIKGSELEQLYNIMKENDINQINTVETSKAANINTLEFWDNNGEVVYAKDENGEYITDDKGNKIPKLVKDIEKIPESIQTYYYRYLYKQQDVVDHIDDEENKAGIQILKKIQDNIIGNPNASEASKIAVKTIQDNLTQNVIDDFNQLMKDCGWTVNDRGELVNEDGSDQLNFDEFYRKARNEAARLGMDSNFIDYITPDENGRSKMPTFMNNVSSKLESIAQSVFNNSIIRQKLPGFHAVQVSKVGYRNNLRYIVDDEGITCEIAIAPWSTEIKQMIAKYGKEKTRKKLEKIGADTFIGYRIPTEGKQSIIKMKVVDFLDETQGSTIIVPDEWVAQSGSDFDIDTIYSIVHRLAIESKKVSKKVKVIKKTPEGKDFEVEETQWVDEDDFVVKNKGRDKRNNEILEAFKTILSDPASFEENASRSNYDDITNALDKYKPKEQNASVYNVFTEVQFMQNAIDGRKLKAFSVNRDTFNSISNIVHGVLQNSGITVEYDLSKINKDNLIAAYGKDAIYIIDKDTDTLNFDEINKTFLSKINYIPYKRTGDIINSVSKGNNICLGTQMLCIEMIADAFNNGDVQHNVKAWPISIWAKSPVTEDDIIHYTTLVNINDKYYIFDMPQSEFIIPTGNVFTEYGETHKEAEIKEYKPRLIPFTKDSLQTLFGSTEEHAASDINQSNDLLNRLSNKSNFKINLDISFIKSIQKQYAKVYHNRIGWSDNNRNVVGKLITPYSSQTTAHILDAIKQGTIPNETDYTFGSFKTLIDLGIDYDTAVSFLAQQAITDLNDEYFKVNSVFTGGYLTVIENVYRKFAQDNGFTFNGEVIRDTAPFKIIIQAIEQNEDFVNKYKDYWGIKSFDDIPSLSEEKFAKNINNGKNIYHYFGVLQIFNNLKKQTNIIEDIAQCSRPDATGAKQTVRATRNMLKNILDYSTDKKHSSLVTTSGNHFLDDLYGLEPWGWEYNGSVDWTDFNINLEASKYKYLAAMLKYGVKTSVEANKQLFLFAGDKFDKLTTFVESRIGRELNDDEFNLFKKYYVSNIYAGLELINSPIFLDKNNNIHSNPNYGNYGPSFWDTERSRIFGYTEPAENGDGFTVENISNPTEEEIEKYNLLTPLQKVLFIKKMMPYDDNIFNKLYIAKSSDRNIKEKGYTNNKISINIDNNNIETLYQQFADAFFNENSLIRLAAIDLLKYAMLVEGFNYKNGAVSKIIPNKVLLAYVNERGENIIETINDDFNINLDNEDEIADKFIRSHSELLRTVTIAKPSSKENQTTLGDVLNRYREQIQVLKINKDGKEVIDTEYDGYISIPVSDETNDILDALRLGSNTLSRKYIKINSATSATDKQTVTLYKVIPNTSEDDKGFTYVTNYNLVPLNLLEENEYSDVSINNNNNVYYNYDFYTAKHDEIINTENFVVIDKEYRAEKYVRKTTYTSDYNRIESLINDKDSPSKELATRTKDQIVNWYLNDRVNKNASTFGIIQVRGPLANTVLAFEKDAAHKESIQDIVLDDLGTILTVKIVPLNDRFVNKMRAIRKGIKKNVTEYVRDISLSDNFYWGKENEYTGLYKIIPIISENTQERIEQEQKDTEITADELHSKFSGIFDEIKYQTTGVRPITEIHDVSTLILKDLQYKKNHGNDSVANSLSMLSIKGFVPNDSESIEHYQTDIYKIAAKYYREAADDILKRIDRFECNGSYYSIANDELYEELREDSSRVNDLYRLILEASTFGNQIAKIGDLQISGEDKETSTNIERIQKAIKDVRNNPKIHKAFQNVYNIYLAKEYATNPNIRMGIVEMTDIFGDSDWFDANIGDITHLNHKQIQVVTKLATRELEKAHLIAADEIADFEEWWNNIEQQLGKDGMTSALDKIIDKEGKFIKSYTKQFIEDKNAWRDKLAKAEANGKTSLEYLKVKHARDKWYIENVSQQYVEQYYKDKYNNEDYILRTNPEAYSEYLTLEQEYYGLGKFALLTTQQRLRKKVIAEKMSDMRADGPLNDFLNKRKEINDKYFEYVESDDFRNTLEKHKEILNGYRKTYPDMTVWDMYTNPDEEFSRFKDSYDWIKCNTVYEFSNDAKQAIYGAFRDLKTIDDMKKRPIMKVINKFDKDIRTDISGQIIGTLYSLDDAREIRDIMRRKYSPYGQFDEDGNLVIPLYTENKEAYDSDANLIKVVPETPIFKENLFTEQLLDEDERTTEIRITKRKLYTRINDIIKNGIVDEENAKAGYGKPGEISAKLLVENCTKEELIELGNLYKDLRAISKAATRIYDEHNSDAGKTDKKPFVYRTNTPALLGQHTYIQSLSGDIRKILENIFYEKDKDGFIKYKKKQPIGNKFIYGYIDLNKNGLGEYTDEAKKYIDEKKTAARKLLDENIVYENTEYYYKARAAAEAQGEDYYNEWFDANHIYNPYKHQWEPIAIWTVMRANPAGNLHAKADYIANRDNTERIPKNGTINQNYNKDLGPTYNNKGSYTNATYNNLTTQEKELLDGLEKRAYQYAITSKQQKFLNAGFAPRVYEKDTDWVDTLNDTLNLFGLGRRNVPTKDWHENVDYSHDFDIEFNMYKLLKAKGYQQPLTLRKQAVGETNEEYAAYKKDYEEQVKQINAANLKLDNDVFSKNWKEVYKRLIEEGNNFLARNRMKDLLYLTLEDLRQREAYATSTRWRSVGDLVKNKNTSTNQNEAFYMTSQTRTADTFQNWIRRFLFEEYKKYNVGTNIADRVQAMNSAKFMMLNLMSGINNVTVGLVNMIMESSAGDYFTNEDLRRAMANYTKNIPGIINHFVNDEVSNETVALMEMFSIEGYDRVQSPFQDFKAQAAEKANSVAYGFLSSGEHFMQNSAMLAMLESHRLYQDPISGKWVIGSEQDYLQGVEMAAIQATLKQLSEESGINNAFYSQLKDYFNDVYIPSIKNDKREAMRFDRNQKDILAAFIRSNGFKVGTKQEAVARRKEFADRYLAIKSDLIKQAKEEFAGFTTIKDNVYFDEKQKRERIKNDSHLTQDHIAELIVKAKSVNKKIHGVYDKLGAAKIERYTLGSLIMQYRKHLYPGFMKHWRKKGYYNELRGTNEYGMFWSVIDLLTTDFRYKGSINDHWSDAATGSDEQEAQKSIANVFKLFINNAIDLGINYKLLPDWQKRNIKRFAGDIGGIMVSLAVIAAIYALMDSDDLKDSKWANEMLYLADRLYGESSMYGVFLSGGLWTEFSNFKDKPIVALDYVYDGMKLWGYISQWATNPDYEPNYTRGTYKGENKMWVTIRRNIPAYRQYQQIKHINSHNNYYKVNENNFAQTLFKNLGISIRNDKQFDNSDPFYSLNR